MTLTGFKLKVYDSEAEDFILSREKAEEIIAQWHQDTEELKIEVNKRDADIRTLKYQLQKVSGELIASKRHSSSVVRI